MSCRNFGWWVGCISFYIYDLKCILRAIHAKFIKLFFTDYLLIDHLKCIKLNICICGNNSVFIYRALLHTKCQTTSNKNADNYLKWR